MESLKDFIIRTDESFWNLIGLGNGLPKDMTPEEKADYQNYRKASMGHEEALKHALRFRRQDKAAPSDSQAAFERGAYDRGTTFGGR
jgi:hypothetical protein